VTQPQQQPAQLEEAGCGNKQAAAWPSRCGAGARLGSRPAWRELAWVAL
jgi:hypothetical protein